jgi:hypothetical protein
MRVLASETGRGPAGADPSSPHDPATSEPARSQARSERLIASEGTPGTLTHGIRPVKGRATRDSQATAYLSAWISPQTPLRPQAWNTPPWKMRS